tara:strand:- start:212 stop:628 length:417 start_codon:yes stop_codon:yes gene_type:complete
MSLKQTKGKKIVILIGDKRVVFTAGGRKRYLMEEYDFSISAGGSIGYVMANGIIEAADGSKHHALLEIDESSSGELCGCGIFIPSAPGLSVKVAFQDEPGFLEKIGKTSDQFFPYKYKYCNAVKVLRDHHLEASGWSR